MFAKIEVRSGGIFIRPPNESTRYGQYDVFTVDLEDGKQERLFRIVKKNSIEGMISYLLGEKRPIKNLQDPDRTNIVNEQLSINVIDKYYEVKDNIISSGKIQLMTERSDMVYDKKSLTKAPNVNLSNFSWNESFELINFLKKELITVSGSDYLKTVYDSFLEQYDSFDKVFRKSKKDNDLKFFETIDITEEDLVRIPKNASNDAIKLINKINTKIELFLKCKVDNIFPKSFYDIPFFPLYITLIREINKSMLNDKLDFSLITTNKWSCFDSSLKQPRHWLNDEYVSFVRSGPAYVLNLDFDIYIRNITSSQLKRFLSGPRMAYWGEGGVAKLSLIDDSPPPEAFNKEQIIACKCYLIERAAKLKGKL